MKKIVVCIVLISTYALSFADDFHSRMLLDKVVFQVSAKQWVKTQSALLSVNINATLTSADLVKARANIMSHLNRVAPGDWHITQFDRSQDSSGLDKLVVSAQVRVPQASLTDIYQNAKNVSKPGETYTINGVEFAPSLDEVQQVKAQLRTQLYATVSREIAQLNKAYPEQHYTVNTIDFFDGDTPVVQTTGVSPRAMVNSLMAMPAPAPLAVSNELTMTAVTELASNRIKKDLFPNAVHPTK